MRYLLCLALLITMSQVFSQETLDYVEVQTALENSSRSLHTIIHVPNSDFKLGTTLEVPDGNLETNSCTEIQSDVQKNADVLTVLNQSNLLDKLYIEINDEYVNLRSKEVFHPKETKLYIELFFKTRDFGYLSCFVPVLKKDTAKKLIYDISTIFDSKHCFNTLKQKI